VDFQTNDSGENLWILVADASKENFRRICVAMERKNVSLHHAQTLDAAFVKAKAIQFAAILVNLDLPDDVPREIARQLPVLTKRSPVLVISTVRGRDVSRLAAENGADSVYLLKPQIDGDDLHERIVFAIKRWRWDMASVEQQRLIEEKTQDLHDAQRLFPEASPRLSGELTTPHQITHTIMELQGAMAPTVLQLVEQLNALSVRIATLQAQFEITTAGAEEKHRRWEESIARLNQSLFENPSAISLRIQSLEQHRAQQAEVEKTQAYRQARIWAAIAGGALTLGAAILKLIEHWWPK
jgi:DNA-binding response OmpR family regulator